MRLLVELGSFYEKVVKVKADVSGSGAIPLADSAMGDGAALRRQCSRPSSTLQIDGTGPLQNHPGLPADVDVIVNHNIAQANGTLVLLPAVIDQNERVTIEVTA